MEPSCANLGTELIFQARHDRADAPIPTILAIPTFSSPMAVSSPSSGLAQPPAPFPGWPGPRPPALASSPVAQGSAPQTQATPSRRNAPRGLSTPGWQGKSPDAGQGGAGWPRRPAGRLCVRGVRARCGWVCLSFGLGTYSGGGPGQLEARGCPQSGPKAARPWSGRAPRAPPSSSSVRRSRRSPRLRLRERARESASGRPHLLEKAPGQRRLRAELPRRRLGSSGWGGGASLPALGAGPPQSPPGEGFPPQPQPPAPRPAWSRPSSEKQTFPSPRPPAKGWVCQARERRGWPGVGVAGGSGSVLRGRSPGQRPRPTPSSAPAPPTALAPELGHHGSPPCAATPGGTSEPRVGGSSLRHRPAPVPASARKAPGNRAGDKAAGQPAGRMAASPLPTPTPGTRETAPGPVPGTREKRAPRAGCGGQAGRGCPSSALGRRSPPARALQPCFHTPRGEAAEQSPPRRAAAGLRRGRSRLARPSRGPLRAAPRLASLSRTHTHTRGPGPFRGCPRLVPALGAPSRSPEPGTSRPRSVPRARRPPRPPVGSPDEGAPRPSPPYLGRREPGTPGEPRGEGRRGRSGADPDPTPAAAEPSRSPAEKFASGQHLQPRSGLATKGPAMLTFRAAAVAAAAASGRPPPRLCQRSGSRACTPPLPSMNGGEGMQRGAPREPEPRSDFPGRALPARTHGEEPPRRRQPLGGAPTSARLRSRPGSAALKGRW
ncbi:basic proline-rich protein-like [Vombatus ursinus]|uniref:basic proline-rich protein-like n=1 Tax=Vombatus ursinus TaxID=29139 RepID=UPI000FFD831D|nr:basic proline-rich protein-like [Vombatus ursinus]